MELVEEPRAVLPERASIEESSLAQTPVELDQLLEIDGPSVLEFTEVVEQAEQAIAEALAQEREALKQATGNVRGVGKATTVQPGEVRARAQA